jgi:hypothetical protein
MDEASLADEIKQKRKKLVSLLEKDRNNIYVWSWLA